MNYEAFQDALEKAPAADLTNILTKLLKENDLQEISHLITKNREKLLKILQSLRIPYKFVSHYSASALFPELTKNPPKQFAARLTERLGATLAARVLETFEPDDIDQIDRDGSIDQEELTNTVEQYYSPSIRAVAEDLVYEDKEWVTDYLVSQADPKTLLDRALEAEIILGFDDNFNAVARSQ